MFLSRGQNKNQNILFLVTTFPSNNNFTEYDKYVTSKSVTLHFLFIEIECTFKKNFTYDPVFIISGIFCHIS